MPRQKPNPRARQVDADAGVTGSKANGTQGKVYRGRRRLPKLPGRRYFAVVSTAEGRLYGNILLKKGVIPPA